MAIDTASKRLSSLDFEEVWSEGMPIPDGTIDQGDRQHSLWSYSGILAGAAAALVNGPVCWAAGQVIYPGFRDGQVIYPAFRAGQRYC